MYQPQVIVCNLKSNFKPLGAKHSILCFHMSSFSFNRACLSPPLLIGSTESMTLNLS